ncbi:MAG: hypothetical protein ACXWDM_05340 [Nocardioides sp.]
MPWEDPVNDKVGNILLSRMMGADVRLDPSGFDIGIRRSWEDELREVEASGGTPYPIPAGAREHPLGGLGFAQWAFELAEQEKQLGVFFDTIIVCTVTATESGTIASWFSGDCSSSHSACCSQAPDCPPTPSSWSRRRSRSTASGAPPTSTHRSA